jgi:hypothetical protein
MLGCFSIYLISGGGGSGQTCLKLVDFKIPRLLVFGDTAVFLKQSNITTLLQYKKF